MSLRVAAGSLVAALAAAAALLLWPRGDATLGPTWDDPATGIRFRLLRPVSFAMGSPGEESGREVYELLHDVRLTRPFYLAETEITQAQWMTVMGENPSYFAKCGLDCPVERVSWLDAGRFVQRLNARGPAGYRLPTEAEWEFACRGQGTLPFGTARGLSSAFANVNGHYAYHAPRGPHRRTTMPARSFPPNWADLYDMAGNVWEWTQDEFCAYETLAPVDPLGACGSGRRVLRGGSWAFDAGSARCAARYARHPGDAGSGMGIRLAHDAF